MTTAFSTGAAGAAPRPRLAGRPPSRRSRALRRRPGCPPPKKRSGATAASASSTWPASSPVPAGGESALGCIGARSGRAGGGCRRRRGHCRRPGRRRPGSPTGCHATVGVPDEADDSSLGAVLGDANDALTLLNDAFCEPIEISVPDGADRRRRSWSSTATASRRRHRSPGWSSTPARHPERRSSRCSTSPDGLAHLSVPVTELVVDRDADLAPRRRPGAGRRQPGRSPVSASTVAQGATLRSGTAAFGGDYSRLRVDTELAGRGAHGDLYRRLLRIRHAAARLPHLPGPRRAGHHLEPAVQGCARREGRIGLHRPDQDPPRRTWVPGVPDQPQPQALRRRVGRVRAQPRDREQRGPVLPCVDRRTRSTPSSASTSRVEASPPIVPSGSSSRASSTRSSRRCPLGPFEPVVRDALDRELERSMT